MRHLLPPAPLSDKERGKKKKRRKPIQERLWIPGVFMLAFLLVFEDDVQRMDDAGDVTQDCEQDVDEEIGAAATLQENAERREDDGKDNLADIACGERHDD